MIQICRIIFAMSVIVLKKHVAVFIQKKVLSFQHEVISVVCLTVIALLCARSIIAGSLHKHLRKRNIFLLILPLSSK